MGIDLPLPDFLELRRQIDWLEVVACWPGDERTRFEVTGALAIHRFGIIQDEANKTDPADLDLLKKLALLQEYENRLIDACGGWGAISSGYGPAYWRDRMIEQGTDALRAGLLLTTQLRNRCSRIDAKRLIIQASARGQYDGPPVSERTLERAWNGFREVAAIGAAFRVYGKDDPKLLQAVDIYHEKGAGFVPPRSRKGKALLPTKKLWKSLTPRVVA